MKIIDLKKEEKKKENKLITALKSYMCVCAYTHHAVGWMSPFHTSPHLYTANYISYNRPMPFSPGFYFFHKLFCTYYIFYRCIKNIYDKDVNGIIS